MKKAKKFSVAILGLGNIGMLYDFDDANKKNFLSHTKSFNHHPGFEITHLIDSDEKKLNLAAQKYSDNNIKFVQSIEQLNTLPDLLVLSSTPEVNFTIYNQLKNKSSIKLFLIEKPFLTSESNLIPSKSTDGKCVVNYIRKFNPFFLKFRENVTSGIFGNPLGVHIWYSKGLRNNGSHMLDLLFFLFGNNYDIKSIHKFQEVNDYKNEDLSTGFVIDFFNKNNKFPVTFQVANEHSYSLIEIDLLFESKRLRIFDFGNKVQVYSVKNDPIFPGYQNLIPEKIYSTMLNFYGLHTANYLYNLLEGKINNISDLTNEFEINRLINIIKSKHE